MGPPIYIGGNGAVRVDGGRGAMASMGPPIYIGGNAIAGVATIGNTGSASMGPPIYIGGNITSDHLTADGIKASMGPPIYIGGNFSPLPHSTVGSSPALQWGHRFISVETFIAVVKALCYSIASMGPPIYIGGNHTIGKR